MKIAITGTTRGLGKFLFEHFNSVSEAVITFNRGDNLEDFVDALDNVDIFINNSYLEGKQVELFDIVASKSKRMVVMGSIAADYPDPKMPLYSVNKKVIQEKASKLNNILYIKLTGKSYKDSQLILDVINLWIKNPTMKMVEFYAE